MINHFRRICSALFIFLTGLWFWPSLSMSLGVRGGGIGGLMQQPSSQYYHLVYGAYGEVSAFQEAAMARFLYAERPKFKSQGYIDQEYAAFAYLGSRVAGRGKRYGISTYAGAARVTGIIKPVEEGDREKRGYSLDGFSLAAEASYEIARVHGALSYHCVTATAGRDDLKMKVAWPFNFFLLHLGGVY